jgi:broad specificity phosphatase PhoE
VKLFLVRHGETESNRVGLALGRADVPLNERGLWQAKMLANALVGEPFTAVYTSPLRRARQTAEAIAERHGLTPVVEPGLIEMDIGELDGLTFAEIRERHPGLLEKWASPEGQATAIFGSESLADVRDRAWRRLESLARRHADETVCAVTHNFVILSVLTRALGMELPHFRRLRHAVAAVSVLEFRGDRVRVLRMNDSCHLEAGE